MSQSLMVARISRPIAVNAFCGLEVGEMAERECQVAVQAVDQNLEGTLKSGEPAAFERVGCQFGGFLCVETIGAQIGDYALKNTDGVALWHAVKCQDCRGIQAGNVAMPYVLDHASDENLTKGAGECHIRSARQEPQSASANRASQCCR